LIGVIRVHTQRQPPTILRRGTASLISPRTDSPTSMRGI
jgi:hypothetical protein